MKKLIVIISAFTLVISACSQTGSGDIVNDRNENARKLVELYTKYGLSQEQLIPLLDNQEFLATLDTLSFEKFELTVKGFSEFQKSTTEMTAYWEKTKDTPEFKAFIEERTQARGLEDFEKLAKKYPEISEKIGLTELVEKRKIAPIEK